jgi:hypothetical protein
MKDLLSTTAIVLALATPALSVVGAFCALNLLEAKGYRDFRTVRESGPNFLVDAARDGKNVTVINRDTGQIGI